MALTAQEETFLSAFIAKQKAEAAVIRAHNDLDSKRALLTTLGDDPATIAGKTVAELAAVSSANATLDQATAALDAETKS